MQRGNYNRTGGMTIYPFRETVSNLIAKTGLVKDFRGVENGETHVPFGNFEGELLAQICM